MKEPVYHSPQTYIKEITGGVRLVGSGIETSESQGEVNRIDVVEVVASESDARWHQYASQENQVPNLAKLQNSEQNEDRLSVIQA
jgi:hypothetical protein